MGVTPGLPLNWSWMHKPSVFLAVCQWERGGGSCRSGLGLNDGAHNLCLARQWLCELWLVPLMLPCVGIRQGDGLCCRPTSHLQVARKSRVTAARDRFGDSSRKWNERGEWMRARGRKWGNGQEGCGERVKERGRCAAGERIVLVNEDLGHCVQANL